MANLWKRLGPWTSGEPVPDDGELALRALADVAEARRSLDQAELSAVRVARRHGRSWTEIATMLTVTRQAAWERWREIDPDDDPAPRAGAEGEIAIATAAQSLVRARRRRMVRVPDLVGLTWADALAILTPTGLEAVSATPDIAQPESYADLRPVIVVRQYPDPDTRVPAASAVKVWLERGDGEAGVREPRRPSPPPRTARAQREESIEEAVG